MQYVTIVASHLLCAHGEILHSSLRGKDHWSKWV